MKKKIDYIQPTSRVVAFTANAILAASGLRYTDEEADENLEILTKKQDSKRNSIWD